MTRLTGLLAAAAAAAALATLSGCSSEITAADVYKVGCPAVDTVVGGGTLANKATVFGLEKLRDSGQLDPGAEQWVDSAIKVLQGAKPEDLPADAKSRIIDGCAQNGYPISNLK
jgi:hypothetical protein